MLEMRNYHFSNRSKLAILDDSSYYHNKPLVSSIFTHLMPHSKYTNGELGAPTSNPRSIRFHPRENTTSTI